MWNHMMFGPKPFTTNGAGKLQLALAPVISSWMWKEDGTITCNFLGSIDLTYVMAAKKDSWEAKIKGYVLSAGHGTKDVHIAGAVVGLPHALDVRNKKYTTITVTLE